MKIFQFKARIYLVVGPCKIDNAFKFDSNTILLNESQKGKFYFLDKYVVDRTPYELTYEYDNDWHKKVYKIRMDSLNLVLALSKWNRLSVDLILIKRWFETNSNTLKLDLVKGLFVALLTTLFSILLGR